MSKRRNIAKEVKVGLQEVKEHRAGKRELRTAEIVANGTRQYWYRYPDDSKPWVKRLKRLAAKAGRTLYGEVKHREARDALELYMLKLPTPELRYWAQVWMLDRRWSDATGEGAFWAVASRVVNELAREELRRRGDRWRAKHGDAMFVVEEEVGDEQAASSG